MKLWLVEQACSQLTDVQDTNKLIYTTYKKYSSLLLIDDFVKYYGACYSTINSMYTEHIIRKYMICWKCKEYERDDYLHQTRTNSFVLIIREPRIDSPGICYECLNTKV
jgi:hypothetical protein